MQLRILPAVLLLAYTALLIKLLVLKDVVLRIGRVTLDFSGYATGPANLVPLATIMPYLLGERGQLIALFNLAGNIVLFVPFGFLVPFVYQALTWRTALVLAVLAPLAVELTQVVFRVGIFDIDDVILNGLGVMIGYGVFVLYARWVRLCLH